MKHSTKIKKALRLSNRIGKFLRDKNYDRETDEYVRHELTLLNLELERIEPGIILGKRHRY